MGGPELKQQWLYLAGFGLAVAGAFGALAYLLIGGREQITAAVIGLGLLGISQIIILALVFDLHDAQNFKLRKLTKEQVQAQDAANESIDEIYNQLAQFETKENARAGELVAGIDDIKTTFGAFMGQMQAAAANPPRVKVEPAAIIEPVQAVPMPAPAVDISAVPLPEPEPVPFAAFSLADKITYALEPLVDIPTKRTAHYRLQSSMELEGEALVGEALFQVTARAGMRPAIDALAVDEALALLERLRARDPHLCILVPIGAETLQDESSLLQLLTSVAASPFANGLVIELPHVVLAGLGERGLEGLAKMVRQGLVFALAQASIAGLDLDAMKLLNVKLVGLHAANLGGEAPSETLLGFAQLARLSRINVYVTDVTNAASVPHVSALARLACGICFAEPRRVKRAAERPVVLSAVAA